jgi:hypothetical protein
MAFVPGMAGSIDKFAIPSERAATLIATLGPDVHRGDEGGKTEAFDFDGDGKADLVQFSEVMFGPSDGWNVFVRQGDQLVQAFGISGAWADARDGGSAVAVRFEANLLGPGEARFSTMLRYDRGSHAWSPALKAYGAVQGKVPTVGEVASKLVPFQTVGAAALRSDPVVDDAPKPQPDDTTGDDFGKTATLHGNVLATYTATAKGIVLASEGEWRYVAFDPAAAKPTATSLAHGMDMDGVGTSWLCGWVKATEIK